MSASGKRKREQGDKLSESSLNPKHPKTASQTAIASSANVRSNSESSQKDNDVNAPVNTSPPESPEFWQLLDFSTLVSEDEISARFDVVANALLNDFYITIINGSTETEYEILELEFYFQKSGCHEDPFTHGSEEQERSGQWYFHRAPKRAGSQPALTATVTGGYRGGTRKGMDLTLGGPVSSKYFGNGNNSSQSTSAVLRGGALLRSLRRRSDSKVISGPSLLVDEVLRASGTSALNDLVSSKWNGDISALRPTTHERAIRMFLHARPTASSANKSRVFCSPRIGLDLSNPETTTSPTHPRVKYVGKPYRYFTHPHLLTANGRTQTFLGTYLESEHLENESELKKTLCSLTGIKEQTIAKYLSDYRFGYDEGDLSDFVGSVGKGVCASASAYLKMMGTLKRVINEIN